MDRHPDHIEDQLRAAATALLDQETARVRDLLNLIRQHRQRCDQPGCLSPAVLASLDGLSRDALTTMLWASLYMHLGYDTTAAGHG